MNGARPDYHQFKRQWIAHHSVPTTAADIERILADSIQRLPPNVPFQHLRWTRGSTTIELLTASGELITALTRRDVQDLTVLRWLSAESPVVVCSGTPGANATWPLGQVLNHVSEWEPPPRTSIFESRLVIDCIDAFMDSGGGGSSGYPSSPPLPPIPGTCARCGRYCHWPTYYQGVPYGSYCIQKVRGW